MALSYAQYAGNGSTTTYSFPFPYLLKAHVKVYTGLNLVTGAYTSLLAEGVDYTWLSATQIQMTVAPSIGVTLTIRRETPTATRLVDWSDGSNLIAADMDTADLQNFYAVQDQQDKNEAVAAAQTQASADASTALASIANVLPYTPLANVASIPVSAANGARVEVFDSTGIESFSPLSGRPVGFVGSSQLKVRLVYTTAGTTWTWFDYSASNPDGRYIQQSAISSSTSSSSTTTVANSAAVKTAKDAADAASLAATAAQTTANTGVTNAASALSAANAAQLTANTGVTNAAAAQAAATSAQTAANNAQTTANSALAGLATVIPAGAVFYFAASTAPTGYLKANGDTVPNGSGTVQGVTANFAALYAILGSTYGSAGKLPDLRGEFVRGWDDSRGVDTSRSFGSSQTDELKSHNHSITPSTMTGRSGGFSAGPGSQPLSEETLSIGNTGGAETRPRNVALLACIKY